MQVFFYNPILFSIKITMGFLAVDQQVADVTEKLADKRLLFHEKAKNHFLHNMSIQRIKAEKILLLVFRHNMSLLVLCTGRCII